MPSAFVDAYPREHATTRKVLHAFPREHSEFRPHERSSTARKLAWMFAVEEAMMLKGLRHEKVLTGAGFPPAPEWDAIVETFDRTHEEVMRELKSADELKGTVEFIVGPKQTGDYELIDFLWFLLSDQIHHRGQFSVYLRMVGGKVPSIYGPSADEPWF